VNGHEAPISRVNAAFRGIRVPAGKSVIEMHFRPWTVRVGILVSFGTLVAAILWLFFTNRHARESALDSADQKPDAIRGSEAQS
jgi:uncharacterized membrane protein YfhO